jgi:TonB family protein
MGRIEEYDHKRNKRLLISIPIGIAVLSIILFSLHRSQVVEKVFLVGYEGPMQLIPEIRIIDEREIKGETSKREQHTLIARNVVLDTDRREKDDNPDRTTSEEFTRIPKNPYFDDVEGDQKIRSYPSRADVPFSEDYVLLKMVEPVYPPDALSKGLEGYVLVEAYVGKDGRVIESYVRSSYGPISFEKASLEAVRQFLFKPSIQEGKPIPFWVSFLIRFEYKL